MKYFHHLGWQLYLYFEHSCPLKENTPFSIHFFFLSAIILHQRLNLKYNYFSLLAKYNDRSFEPTTIFSIDNKKSYKNQLFNICNLLCYKSDFVNFCMTNRPLQNWLHLILVKEVGNITTIFHHLFFNYALWDLGMLNFNTS